MELAIVNLEGDLAHPDMLGLLYAREPELEVELEITGDDDVEEAWFEQPVECVEDHPPTADGLRHGILRQALRFLIRRGRDER